MLNPRRVRVVIDAGMYRQERIGALERRIAFLEMHQAQLERLLAVALLVGTGGTYVQPLDLLDALESVDRLVQLPDMPTVPWSR